MTFIAILVCVQQNQNTILRSLISLMRNFFYTHLER